MGKIARTGTKARVFIVDDHPLVRQGLSLLINQQGTLAVVGEAGDAQQALAGLERTRPDLAIIDIGLKGMDGLELAKCLRKQLPHVKVLILSMYDEAIYAERALKAGARGYIMKQEANEELLNAIQRVLAGKIYLSEAFSSVMLDQAVGGRSRSAAPLLRSLTDRELEILRMIGQGKKNQEIAVAAGLSNKTVQTYKENIKKKLHLRNSSELTRYAMEWCDR
jgi:DNA-binding NarL/FixJ family response regulator